MKIDVIKLLYKLKEEKEMKKMVLGLMISLLLFSVNAFAADGDLIVNGNLGVGANVSPFAHTGYGNITLNGTNGGNISFSTAGFEKSQIFSDSTKLYLSAPSAISLTGNVGIGTTNPGAKLHVTGGYVITDGTYGFRSYGVGALGDTNTESVELNHNGSGGFARLWTRATGTGVARDLAIDTTGYFNQIYLKGNGNVGIGTTSPGTNNRVDIKAISEGGNTINLQDSGGNNTGGIRSYYATGNFNSPTTIFRFGGNTAFVMVSGTDDAGHYFSDIVFCLNNSVIPVHNNTVGSGQNARSYTYASGDLLVSIGGSIIYKIRTIGFVSLL